MTSIYIPPVGVMQNAGEGIGLLLARSGGGVDAVVEDVAYALAYADGIARMYVDDMVDFFSTHEAPDDGGDGWIEWLMMGSDAGKAWVGWL